MACLVLFIPWPLLVESVCLEHTDAQGGQGHSALGHGLWKAPGSQGDRRLFWSEVWLAAREKGCVEASFVCSVSGSDLLSTLFSTQSGVQGVALVAATPEKMRRSKASLRKGKEGWLKGVFQRLQWRVRLGGRGHSQGSSD